MSYGSAKSSGSVSEGSGSGSVGSGSDSGGTEILTTDSSGSSSSTSGFLTYHGLAVTLRASGVELPRKDLFGAVEFGEAETWYGGFRQTA